MPAARGADAEVPVWSSVHMLCMSVVNCNMPRHSSLLVLARTVLC